MYLLKRVVPLILITSLVIVGCDTGGVAPEPTDEPTAESPDKRIDPCGGCEDDGGGGSNPSIVDASSDAEYAWNNGYAVRLSGQTLASEVVDVAKVTVTGLLDGNYCGSRTNTQYGSNYANIGSPVVSCNTTGTVDINNVGSNGYHYIKEGGYSTSKGS